MKSGKCILRGKRNGKLYSMNAEESANLAFDTLHLRHGHSSLFPPRSACISCQKGKQARNKFPKSHNRARNPLDLIVSDVAGPFQVSSRYGNRFAITFTDDATRHTTVFFMGQKTEALDMFATYTREIQSRTGKRIKALRTDNGGEYLSRKFSDFMEENGIEHQRTVIGDRT